MRVAIASLAANPAASSGKARTLLVRTNEDNNEEPKIPRYKSVNQVLHGQTSEAGTVEPFRSKQSALQTVPVETIQRHYSRSEVTRI